MRVLVIGASGQVGRALLDLLRARGDEAVGTFHSRPAVGLVPCDLARPEEAAALVGSVRPDAAIQVGGFTNVDAAEEDPDRAYRVNAEGTGAVVRAAAEVRAHFTYFSTDYVFDGAGGPVDEGAEPRPLSHYGRGKLEGERRAGPSALIVRSANIYSYAPGERNFFMQVWGALREGKTFPCFSDQGGTPTYAPALAAATLEAVDSRWTGPLHLAGPEYLTRLEWGRRIAQDFGFEPSRIIATTTRERPQKAPRPARGGVVSRRRGPVLPGMRDAHALLRARMG